MSKIRQFTAMAGGLGWSVLEDDLSEPIPITDLSIGSQLTPKKLSIVSEQLAVDEGEVMVSTSVVQRTPHFHVNATYTPCG